MNDVVNRTVKSIRTWEVFSQKVFRVGRNICQTQKFYFEKNNILVYYSKGYISLEIVILFKLEMQVKV